MKKGLLLLSLLCLLLIGGVYIFIPAQLSISSFAFVKVQPVAAYRCLVDESKWAAWWPGSITTAPAAVRSAKNFHYNNVAYQIEQTSVQALGIRISNGATQTTSILQPLEIGNDSTVIKWTCTLTAGSNPFSKLAAYRKAALLKKNMDAVLNKVQAFLSKTENVYGIAITHAIVKDSTLVVTRQFSTSYPAVEMVYELIKQLRQYVAQQGAQEINYPMLHVKERGDGQFETMVALPVNKELKGTRSIFFKRMQVPTMLATDVYGGPEKLKRANAELENFSNDHNLFSPAISFESLVTDRLAERDTSKWVTKIYLPVMVSQRRKMPAAH